MEKMKKSSSHYEEHDESRDTKKKTKLTVEYHGNYGISKVRIMKKMYKSDDEHQENETITRKENGEEIR